MATEVMVTQGFKEGGRDGDLFEGTAAYYARYRRPYPPQVVSYLVKAFALDRRGRLLDAGCGTGQVFLVLAEHFEEVVALDADQEMVRAADRIVRDRGLDRVQVLHRKAEDIGPDLGTFRMATFGASFHWMDRARVAELVYDRLQPGGHLVVLAPGGLHSGSTDWEAIVREVIAKWLGTERRAGGGVYNQGERHEQAIGRTRFGAVKTADIYVDEIWTVDDILGYLYSTSTSATLLQGSLPAPSNDPTALRSDLGAELDRSSFAIASGIVPLDIVHRLREAIGMGLMRGARQLLSAGKLAAADVDRVRDVDTGMIYAHERLGADPNAPSPEVQPLRMWTSRAVKRTLIETRQHPAIVAVARAILGPKIVATPQFALRAHLPASHYVCFPWHQDVNFLDLADKRGARIVNFWIPLLPIDRDAGGLEVIRGSHRAGPLPHRREAPRDGREGLTAVAPESIPDGEIVVPELKPGDALLMLDKTVHRSRMNHSTRVRWSIDIRFCESGRPLGREGHSIELD
jgi:SAM-dependent methyltransferase